MTVYVDDMCLPYGRMIMCHMIADSAQEMHDFAHEIGIARHWFQGDHYDICLAKKRRARRLGAIEVTRRAMVRLRRAGGRGLMIIRRRHTANRIQS